MKKRKLGKSGIKVSPMGLGGWAIGGPFLHPKNGVLAYGQVDDKESIKAIRKAIDMGITLFDTANVYGGGRSERVLGEALEGYREDVIIATKFATTWDMNSDNPDIPCQITGSDVTPGGIKKACDASLRRLRTDYIDVYQLHDGGLEFEVAENVLETLEELVKERKIRYYGWSTDDPDRAELFAKRKHCATVQFRHNIFSHNDTMISNVIEKYGIGGLIKGPLGYGILTGKYKADSQLPEDHMWHGTEFGKGKAAETLERLERIREILQEDGRTLPQAALAWIWAQHELLIPIPGFKNSRQVEENVGAMKFGPLKKEQLKAIDELL
ncbi:MAG: aldo/keto reductase [Candidatus Lokiarchaeota archaeon]|nr:aldo/keto reductase [Candidatus Lokiarchaeota archaeon]